MSDEIRSFTLQTKHGTKAEDRRYAEPFGADGHLREAFEQAVEDEPDARLRLGLARNSQHPTRYLFDLTQQAFEYFRAGYLANSTRADEPLRAKRAATESAEPGAKHGGRARKAESDHR